ncbi:MAG: hypothetical protein DME20_08750 [Verrucomicrobia bacterium]|nr:MAG: hypothetical protein DME74_06090 [Verrucomicrobiota bacterium]PYK48543.1 MAG: hypothetical protein DME20_08750 [Verrucomicrobiota bacterium]
MLAARYLGYALSLMSILYVSAFFWRFDVISSPVRDNDHGWLGPVIRGDKHIKDLGKVYYYEGTDFSSYRTFRPLCKIWLKAHRLE